MDNTLVDVVLFSPYIKDQRYRVDSFSSSKFENIESLQLSNSNTYIIDLTQGILALSQAPLDIAKRIDLLSYSLRKGDPSTFYNIESRLIDCNKLFKQVLMKFIF